MVVAKVTEPGITLIDFPATWPSARTLLQICIVTILSYSLSENSPLGREKIEKIKPTVSSLNAMPTKINPRLPAQNCYVLPVEICGTFSYKFRFLRNCPPTPPLS